MTYADREHLKRQAERRLTEALIDVQGGYLTKAQDRAREAIDALERVVGKKEEKC